MAQVYDLKMLKIASLLLIAQSTSASPPLQDVLPPPGMYSIYRNGVGTPLYFYVPDAQQRSVGNRMQVFDKAGLDFVCDQIKMPRLQEVVINDSDTGPATASQSAAPMPSFRQRLGSALRNMGQSLSPSVGGYSMPTQAVPLPSIQPMQFQPMQSPQLIYPTGRTMGGPTYSIAP